MSAEFATNVIRWHRELESACFNSFFSDAVCARLEYEDFNHELEFWREQLGDDARFAALCGTDGVACRLTDKKFKKELEFWREQLGDDAAFVTLCGTDGVACRLRDKEFKKRLLWW